MPYARAVKQDDPAGFLSPEQFSDLLSAAGQDRPLYKFTEALLK